MPGGGPADAVVLHAAHQLIVLKLEADGYFLRAGFVGQAVPDSIFDKGLQDHGRQDDFVGVQVFRHHEFVIDLIFKAHRFRIQVLLQQFQLLGYGEEGLFGKFQDHAHQPGKTVEVIIGGIDILLQNVAADGVHAIENEMRIHLQAEDSGFGFGDELFVFTQKMLMLKYFTYNSHAVFKIHSDKGNRGGEKILPASEFHQVLFQFKIRIYRIISAI